MTKRTVAVALALLAAACAPATDTAIGSAESAIAIPGPWDPPASTRAIAATQFVPVVDPPPVSPLGSCASTNPFTCSCTHPACTPGHPGTVELRDYLLARFPNVRNSGTYCCRQNSNNLAYLSVHAIGRAIDLGVDMIGGDADNTVGDEVANWLVENAEYIGIQRVIWDYTYWNGERGFGSLGGSPHTDHVHVELSVAGAARETLFFTLGAPGETCTPACVGTRLINEDCSSVDCADTGAQCLESPPRCGQPPPPEPAESVLVDGASFPALSAVGDPRRLAFAGPTRLFDMRSSTDGMTWDDATSELTWSTGMPATTAGIWLNIAVIASNPGYVTVFPTGSPRPDTSNVTVSGSVVRANLVPAPLGTNQSVSFYEFSPVEMVGDAYATMGAEGDGLQLVDPVRAFDSRTLDERLLADETTAVDPGAPAGATGVLGSVAALQPPANGFLSVFPCGTSPDTSTVNLLADEIASNQVVSAVGPDGTICLRPSQDMHVVFDVIGFFSPDGMLEYQALTPTRLVDTRNAVYYDNRLAAHQTIELPLADAEGMPANGWAAVLNVTTVQADGHGFLTVFACERGTAPGTSAHNFSSEPRATLVTTDLGTSGRACLSTSTRAHIIVDLLGIWTHSDGTAPSDPDVTTEPDPDPGTPGEEPTDAGVDAGAAGLPSTRDPEGGCSCRAVPSPVRGHLGAVVVGLLALAVCRRRTSRPCHTAVDSRSARRCRRHETSSDTPRGSAPA